MTRQQLIKVLEDSYKLIGDLMPGVKHIALQDYKALNDVQLELVATIRLLKEGERNDSL